MTRKLKNVVDSLENGVRAAFGCSVRITDGSLFDNRAPTALAYGGLSPEQLVAFMGTDPWSLAVTLSVCVKITRDGRSLIRCLAAVRDQKLQEGLRILRTKRELPLSVDPKHPLADTIESWLDTEEGATLYYKVLRALRFMEGQSDMRPYLYGSGELPAIPRSKTPDEHDMPLMREDPIMDPREDDVDDNVEVAG